MEPRIVYKEANLSPAQETVVETLVNVIKTEDSFKDIITAAKAMCQEDSPYLARFNRAYPRVEIALRETRNDFIIIIVK